MTTNATPISPLDGLLRCGECGDLMASDHGTEPRYICRPKPGNHRRRCRIPQLHANRTASLIIGQVLQAVLTEANISSVLAAANDPQRSQDADEQMLTKDDVLEIKEHPDLFIQALGGAAETRNFLRGFITEIQAHPTKGVVHYVIPLPADSPLAGMSRQEISIPEEALT